MVGILNRSLPADKYALKPGRQTSRLCGLKPIFDSFENAAVDNQRLTSALRSVGTTSGSGGEPDALGDFLQNGREGDFGSADGLRSIALELTAKQKAAALEREFDLLEVVQAADDLGPFGCEALLFHADFEFAFENQRQEAAEDVAADGL